MISRLLRPSAVRRFDVVTGWLVAAHPDDRDDVEGAVSGSVSTAAEPVRSAGPPAARWLGSDAAEFREGGFVADPVTVISSGDQELAGDFDADAMKLEKLKGSRTDKRVNLLVQRLHLVVEGRPAPGQVSQGGLHSGEEQSILVLTQRDEVGSFRAQAEAAVDQGPFGQHDQLVSQWRRSSDHHSPPRVERLRAGLDSTGSGDPQGSDHLDDAGLCLRHRSRGLP